MKELIHFAHGNGFPALCYRQMLEALTDYADYCYLDRIGHNPKYPVSENWHNLVAELIESVRLQADRPVIAVGHSLGGALSFLAAAERPELFKAVILLDSPLLGPLKSTMVRLAKALGFIDHVTPAHKTRARRQHWQTRDEVIDYLRSRELFANFTTECLYDYVDYGLEHTNKGYSLRFNRAIEYRIYRTIPHIIPAYEGKFNLPAALIYGAKSNIVGTMDLHYMKKKFGIVCQKTSGSHLFPMEYPQQAAQEILNALSFLGL
ncbi:MAG: alpha/beta hydrolase [Legionella sp. 40-6]|nr:alpha/beta hydrolase [Legionella sp.]OJY39329.1 MAG: alpha/beta hydrolase [Legionella sp. 40-6]